jgi:hypothetical protein
VLFVTQLDGQPDVLALLVHPPSAHLVPFHTKHRLLDDGFATEGLSGPARGPTCPPAGGLPAIAGWASDCCNWRLKVSSKSEANT